MQKKLTKTMEICLAAATSAPEGTLYRHPGGYWAAGNEQMRNGIPVNHFGAATVHGLTMRGHMEYCAWKTGRNGLQFPVAAKVVDSSV